MNQDISYGGHTHMTQSLQVGGTSANLETVDGR